MAANPQGFKEETAGKRLARIRSGYLAEGASTWRRVHPGANLHARYEGDGGVPRRPRTERTLGMWK